MQKKSGRDPSTNAQDDKIAPTVSFHGLHLGVQGWYAPAVNIHRNAFSGRNYKYYSEDPFLSGAAAAAEIKGVQSKGMYVKHFALNDQETNRIDDVALGLAAAAFGVLIVLNILKRQKTKDENV